MHLSNKNSRGISQERIPAANVPILPTVGSLRRCHLSIKHYLSTLGLRVVLTGSILNRLLPKGVEAVLS